MIKELYHRTPNATIKTRCQIIVLEASPMRVLQIAQVIFSSENTVARCIHAFTQSRLENLLPSRDLRTPAQGHAGLLETAALDHRARSQNAGLCLLELDSPLARLAYVAAETELRLDESRIRHSLHAHRYDLLRQRSGAGPIHRVSGQLSWAESSRKEHALFCAVFSQVLAPADGGGRRKISVVVDTSRMHFAKPVLARFSAHPEQIELVTRPSSSPQLNPARRFWKHVRRTVTHTTFFQTSDRLLDAVTGVLRDRAVCPQTVRAARRMSRVRLTSCLRSREQDDAHPAGEGGR